MDNHTTHDNIDAALAKTYFGATSKKQNRRKQRLRRLKFSLISLAILGAFALLLIYLGSREDVTRIFNIKTGFIPASQRPVARFEKTAKRTATAAPPVKHAFKTEKTLYDFEKDEDGWEIPGWELDKPDHVARHLKKIRGIASKGTGSIELYAEFPGGTWTGALAEIQHYLDLGNYDALYADIYLPPEAPKGLRAKLMLTVGEDWRFVETARSIRLEPGRWTTIAASISEDSTDWKRTKVNTVFKTDVRKIAIRIESNRAPYSGPIYIDNIRLYSKEKL